MKKRNGSPENIGDKIALLNPVNTFLFFPPLVLSSLLTHLTQRHPEEGQEKGKGSIELLCILIPAGIRYPCLVYNVER